MYNLGHECHDQLFMVHFISESLRHNGIADVIYHKALDYNLIRLQPMVLVDSDVCS